jgi:maleylacetate reductase
MVIASARDRSEVERIAAGLTITLIYDDIAPHVPIDKAEKARTAAINNQIDLLVSIGGGSATDLDKAIALTTGLPIIAVPTTYAGSEATNMWGITETDLLRVFRAADSINFLRCSDRLLVSVVDFVGTPVAEA